MVWADTMTIYLASSHPASLPLVIQTKLHTWLLCRLKALFSTKVSYPLTMLSHSAQDSCLKAHYFAPVLRSWPRHKTFSYTLYSCLLLKPTSTHHANCPISSACRLMRASVLSSHIEGVSTSL